MNILITGGAGFIGSSIVEKLAQDKKNVITVLDELTEQIHGYDQLNSYLYKKIEGKCNFIRGDIRDYSVVEKAISGCDYIIHLAAETGTGQSMYQINRYNEVNIMGTSNIFQAISNTKAKVKKIVLSSSRSVYGEGKYECVQHGVIYPKSRAVEDMQHGDFSMHCPICYKTLKLVPTDENSKVMPSSLYAFTKYAQEKMIETMCKAMDIEYTIFRFQNVYGVGQSLKNPYTGILSIFSTLLLENKKINIFEDGLESRDFINVEDIAEAVVKSLNVQSTNGEIINLGSGKGTTVIEIEQMLKKMYNSDSDVSVTGDFRVGDIAHNIADITKAKKLLEFEPKVTLENGLREFSQWVRKQDIDNSNYEHSLNEMEESGMFIRKNK